MSCPRVWWSDGVPDDGVVVLDGRVAHHLRRVLRVAAGDCVGIFDGRGREWAGRVGAVTTQGVRVIELVSVTPVAEARVPVTLAVAVLKGDQMDTVVRDATMLGAAVIMPMQTTHVTVPSRAWQSGAARDRWQRVAAASAAQCRRSVVPEVRPVTDFETCLAEPAALRLICVEPGLAEADGHWTAAAPPRSVQVLIGPEGGWTAGEIDRAVAAGARLMHLGPRTLRAETAPTVALTMVSSAWGW